MTPRTPVRHLTVDPKSNRVRVIETREEGGTTILTPRQHDYLVGIRRSDARKGENEGVIKPKHPEIKIS